MRHLPRAALLAALLVVAVLLGTCGSKSDGGGPLSSGVLRVGTEGTYAPFQTPWDSIFAALEANRFDVVANEVTITRNERASTTCPSPIRWVGSTASSTTASRSTFEFFALYGTAAVYYWLIPAGKVCGPTTEANVEYRVVADGVEKAFGDNKVLRGVVQGGVGNGDHHQLGPPGPVRRRCCEHSTPSMYLMPGLSRSVTSRSISASRCPKTGRTSTRHRVVSCSSRTTSSRTRRSCRTSPKVR